MVQVFNTNEVAKADLERRASGSWERVELLSAHAMSAERLAYLMRV